MSPRRRSPVEKPVSLRPLSFADALDGLLRVNPREGLVDEADERLIACWKNRGGSVVYVADDGRPTIDLPPNGAPFPIPRGWETETPAEIIAYLVDMLDMGDVIALDVGNPTE
jgi:hypothetical protein